MGNVMQASDIYSALNTAQQFASSDQTLPMLNAVLLEFSEDMVLAAATDRFTLGVQRADYAGEAFDVVLSLADVKTLLRIAKTATRDVGWRTVEIDVRRQRVWGPGEDYRDETAGAETGDVRAVVFKFASGESIELSALDAEFPKYRQLIPAADADHLRQGHTAAVKGLFVTDAMTTRGACNYLSPSPASPWRFVAVTIGL